MTRTRAFHRFHRWTAKLRRRHLRAWLPEPAEGTPLAAARGADLRLEARQAEQLHDDLDWLGDAGQVRLRF